MELDGTSNQSKRNAEGRPRKSEGEFAESRQRKSEGRGEERESLVIHMARTGKARWSAGTTATPRRARLRCPQPSYMHEARAALMPLVAEARLTLHDALESLHRASTTPANQRSTKLSVVVDAICRHALEHGLDQDALGSIVQIASVKTHLDQTSVTTLIKNLYPAKRVPSHVVITIVGALGQGRGKPSPGTQDSLVKWLAIVHDIIENPAILSRLYGVLFGMLDMITIRTSLCHLLSLITRRKHVKPFRIQQLLELSRGLGNEPALQGLLRVYKDYYPDIIIGSTSISRKSFAPQPDAEWRAHISAIQESDTAADGFTTDPRNGFQVLRKGPKRSKISAIPDVHTYHATETSVTLEGIDSVEDFVEKLDQIEPPGQLISFLTDPLLQKYVELRPSPITSTRIDLWLATCLEDQYEAGRLGTGDSHYLSEVLDGLLIHARYTKVLHPAVLAFLHEYLQIWNGRDNVDTLLGLLVYIPFESFEHAYSTYLASLERVLAAQGFSSSEKLISFYSSLLRYQTSVSHPDQQALSDFTTHVATLSTSILLALPPNTGTSLISCILSFYELLSSCSKPHVVPIILPPMHLVYLMVQDASPATLSRTCGIVGNYKLAFDQHPKPVKNYYSTVVTDTLNWCLRDIYNSIWVSRALIVADQKSVGLYCQPSIRSALNDYLSTLNRDYDVGTAFMLSNNAWLASLSAAAWRTIEEQAMERQELDRTSIRRHQGPVSQRSLEALRRQGGVSVDWDGLSGYKVLVLQWLEERGMNGIKQLMFATVTDLKGKV